MSGYEVLQLRRERREMPVLILTAKGRKRTRCRASGWVPTTTW
jgi:DNA-binding response OmpR family regulator